jgi:hypothetical protein
VPTSCQDTPPSRVQSPAIHANQLPCRTDILHTVGSCIMCTPQTAVCTARKSIQQLSYLWQNPDKQHQKMEGGPFACRFPQWSAIVLVWGRCPWDCVHSLSLRNTNERCHGEPMGPKPGIPTTCHFKCPAYSAHACTLNSTMSRCTRAVCDAHPAHHATTQHCHLLLPQGLLSFQ